MESAICEFMLLEMQRDWIPDSLLEMIFRTGVPLSTCWNFLSFVLAGFRSLGSHECCDNYLTNDKLSKGLKSVKFLHAYSYCRIIWVLLLQVQMTTIISACQLFLVTFKSSIVAGMKPALGTGCVEIFKQWCLSSEWNGGKRKVPRGHLTLNFTFLMSFLQRNKRVQVALRLFNWYQVGT